MQAVFQFIRGYHFLMIAQTPKGLLGAVFKNNQQGLLGAVFKNNQMWTAQRLHGS